MAIRFRCRHCQSLMSISSRRAGAVVPCATCGEDVLVPEQDEWSPPIAPLVEEPAASEPMAEEEPFTGFTAVGDEFLTPEPPPSAIPGPRIAEDIEQAREPLFADDAPPGDDDRAFRLPRKKRDEEDMDLTAMVDVVFQLLIFFMVTASFSLQKSIETPTPDQQEEGAAQSLQPLENMQDTSVIVEIDERDAVLVDDEPLADISRLSDALRDRMRKEQKSELLLTASASATHRTVIAVIDAANEVGMQRIRMAAPARANTE